MSQVPTLFQDAGLHERPVPFVPYPSTRLPAGAEGFLSFGQVQSQKDTGKQEEGHMSEEHPCLSHSLTKVHIK